MISFKNILIITLAAFVSVSCAEALPEIPSEELYTRNFIKEFGVPDSDHDWSFATKIEADVSLNGSRSGLLRLYTDSYLVPGTKLLAMTELSGGAMSFTFDVRKGTRHVYVRITDGVETILSGWYAIENGKLIISDFKNSRAIEDDAAISVDKIEGVKVARMSDEAIRYLRNSNLDSYQGTGYSLIEEPQEVQNLYLVNGGNIPANTQYGNPFSVKEALMLFGTYKDSNGNDVDGVFKEGKDNIKKYVETGHISPNALFKTVGEGEVTLTCSWRGVGDQADRFGYYYYTGDRPTPEELWSMNKYVIIGNSDNHAENIISCKSGLTQRYMYQRKDGQTENDYYWDNNDGLTGQWLMDEYRKFLNGDNYNQTVNENDLLRGAKIRLPYFGADGNAPGTYTWPKDVKIGFFIYSVEDVGHDDQTRKFFFSNCENTYYLFNHPYGEKNPWSEDEWNESSLEYGKNKRPYAATFRYNGKLFLSMADGGNDFDLNDLVFTLDNLESQDENDDDLTPDEPVADEESWVLACEDLGNSYDYDFNDIVLDISYVSRTTFAKVTPLAAGGTLDSYIYFGETCLGEIHSLAGVLSGVAAGVGKGTPALNEVIPVIIEVPVNWSVSDGIKQFSIKTVYPDSSKPTGTWITFPNTANEYWNVPQMMLLPKGWEWPTEQTDIRDAYPDFKDWTIDKGNTDWVNNKVNHFTHRP